MSNNKLNLLYKHLAGAYTVYCGDLINGGGIRRFTVGPTYTHRHNDTYYSGLYVYRMTEDAFESIKEKYNLIKI